jgi:DNA-directed RNA polymerase specialized sigma24 family protein
VERHRAAALRLLRRTFSGLQSQHDDIWQEVATALFVRSKERGFGPDELRNYLLGAVAKNAANGLRTAAIQNTHASDPQSGELARLAAAPVEDQVLGELDAENYRSIIRSLSPRQRAVAVAERDIHQGTLRTQRLPEHPPALRKALSGTARLDPEQVASLLPTVFLR